MERAKYAWQWTWAALNWVQNTIQFIHWIASLGSAAVLIIWWNALHDALQTIAPGWQIAFWVAVGLGVLPVLLTIIQLILACRGKKQFLEAYDNRDALNKARGGIAREISQAKEEVWIAWLVAGVAPEQGAFSVTNKKGENKVKKVALMSPKHPALQEFVAMYPNYTERGLKEDIEQATRAAIAAGACVKWTLSTAPMSSITIVDPNSSRGYARIETFLHGVDARYRPSVVIPRFMHKQAFENVRNHFDYLFEKALVATPSTSGTEGTPK